MPRLPLPIAMLLIAAAALVFTAILSRYIGPGRPFRCRVCGCHGDCPHGCWRHDRNRCSRCVDLDDHLAEQTRRAA